MKIKPTATNPVDIACNINVYFPIKKTSQPNRRKFKYNFSHPINPLCSCSLEGGYSPFLWSINTFFDISNNLFDELSSVDDNL